MYRSRNIHGGGGGGGGVEIKEWNGNPSLWYRGSLCSDGMLTHTRSVRGTYAEMEEEESDRMKVGGMRG